MKVSELFDPDFKMLDGTNPAKPYDMKRIMAAMRQLHARVERQGAAYGGDPKKTVSSKTGMVDISKHKFLPAQIAGDE